MRTRNSRSCWMTSGADINNTSSLRAEDSSIFMQAVEKLRENRKKFAVNRKRMLAEGQKTNTCSMRTRNSGMTSGADMNNTSLLRAEDGSIFMQAVEKLRENRKKFAVNRKRMLAAQPLKEDVSSEVKSIIEAKVPKLHHPSKVVNQEFMKEEPKRLTEQVDIHVKGKQKLPMFENGIPLHGPPEEDAIKRVLEETEKKKAIPRETKFSELTAPTKPGKVPEKPVVVTQMKKPQFTKTLYPSTAQEGEKVRFDVKFKGHPEPVIKLYKDDINIGSSTDLKMSLSDEPSSLTVSEIIPEDSGIYKCIATNADGSTSTECKLVVIEGLPEVYEVVMESVPVPLLHVEKNPSLIETVKPAFVDRLTKRWLVVGTSIIFECCVVGQPIPEVYWTEGDSPIKPDSRHKVTFDENTGRCTLIISHCQPDDAGAYTCHAINSVGEATTSAALLPAERKEPPPAPPPPIVCTNAPHLEGPSTFPPSEPVQELQQLDLLPLCVEKDLFIPISEKILESNMAIRIAQPEEEEMQPVEEEAQLSFLVSSFEELSVPEVQNLKVKGKFSSDRETLQYELEIDRLSPNQILPPQFEQLVENTLFTGINTGVGDIQAAGERGYITGSEDESGSEMSAVFPILDIEVLKTNTLLTSFENSSSQKTHVLKAEADSSNSPVTISDLQMDKAGCEEKDCQISCKILRVQSVKKTNTTNIDYGKIHACSYCGKLQKKISRHLKEQHKNEPEIFEMPELPGKELKSENKQNIEKLRKKTFNKLRNLGDFKHNINVLQRQTGVLLVSRRSSEDQKHTVEDYLPCKFCLVFCLRTELWRHIKHCSFRESSLKKEVICEESKTGEKKCIKDGLLILNESITAAQGQKVDVTFYEYVIVPLQDDDISKCLKKDPLVLKLGRVLFHRLGKERSADIRGRLRNLSRLLFELKKQNESSCTLTDFLTPSKLDDCMVATKSLIGVEGTTLNGTLKFLKPSLALKIGELIKKVTTLKRAEAIRLGQDDKRKESEDFLTLFDAEWSDSISNLARQSASEAKFNKKDTLPLTRDLVKLKKYQEEQIRILTTACQENTNNQTLRKLAEVTLSKLISFNKRRGEEPAKMLLESYKKRMTSEGNAEIINTLSPLEKELMKRMELVEVVGKKNRKVPVLLTPAITKAMEVIVKYHISPENPYVFEKGADKHLRGCEVLKSVCNEADLEQPALVTSTRLRKYMATVSQVIDMQEPELQELARHMGHELAVHRQFYRLQEDVTELSKISKLLLAVENGCASKFQGLTLDDIDMQDLDVAVETAEDGMILTNESTETGSTVEVDQPTEGESESSSESEVVVQKEGQRKRLKWTSQERKAIEELILPTVKAERKPPNKITVDKARHRCALLHKFCWKSIKYQAWSMYQQYKKKHLSVAKSLLDGH